MTSGTPYEKMALINNIQKGVNIYDPAHFNDAIGNNVDMQQMMSSWLPRI